MEHLEQEDGLLRRAIDFISEAIGETEVRNRIEVLQQARAQLSYKEAFDTYLPRKPRERFDWYIYTTQRYLADLYAYDVNTGAPVIPTILALGGRVDAARAICNVGSKVNAAAQGQQDVESVLFEILMGAAYVEDGWSVESVSVAPEQKSPDLHAARAGDELFIECKRKQKNSQYAQNERERWFVLSRPLFDYLGQERIPLVLDIVFHQELSALPDDFLGSALVPKLRLATPGVVIDSAQATLTIRPPDLTRLRKHLEHNRIRSNATLLNHLLYGDFDLSRGVRNLIEAKFSTDNPLYIEDVTFAAGAIWSCDATAAINAKARDIRAYLADAVDQLPVNGTCAVHCAVEMYDGEAVEIERYRRIAETATQFETDRDLRWTYCHLLGFSVPPDKNWDVIETVHPFGRIPGGGTVAEYAHDPFLLQTPDAFVYPSLTKALE